MKKALILIFIILVINSFSAIQIMKHENLLAKLLLYTFNNYTTEYLYTKNTNEEIKYLSVQYRDYIYIVK